MRSPSFLLSRRWVIFGLVVVGLAWGAWLLGQWQFDRLDERQARNRLIEQNIAEEPVPAAELLGVGEPVADEEQWRHVTATGEYDVSDTVVVRYRTRDGRSGVEVVVPLVTTAGPALLVDRGWLPAGNRGGTPDHIPPPPDGQVTVTGWVRQSATDPEATRVTDGSTRAVSSRTIGEALGRPVYGGFVQLAEEEPEAADPLAPAELPELDNGPHFFYGLQWWFFGLLAIGGFGWLAYDEWRRAARSERPDHASVDGQHDPGDE